MAFLSYLFYYVPSTLAVMNEALDNLLIYSQVFLSIALPVSMIPLVYFISSKTWAKVQEPSVGHFSGLDLRHRINSPQHSLDYRNNVWFFGRSRTTQLSRQIVWFLFRGFASIWFLNHVKIALLNNLGSKPCGFLGGIISFSHRHSQ